MTMIRRYVLVLGVIAGLLGIGGCTDPEVGSMPAIKGSHKKDALKVPQKSDWGPKKRGR